VFARCDVGIDPYGIKNAERAHVNLSSTTN